MMQTRIGVMLAALSATLILAGCTLNTYSYDDDHHRQRRRSHARRVVHVCSMDCHHHYWDGSDVIALPHGHHHDDHCGHHWDGSHWIVRVASHRRNDHGRADRGHDNRGRRRSDNARRNDNGHGSRRGNGNARRQENDRGHRNVRGQGNARRVAHEHSATCGHIWRANKNKWVKTRKGHIHRDGCGHRFHRGRWTFRP